jgi:hypothetical protein
MASAEAGGVAAQLVAQLHEAGQACDKPANMAVRSFELLHDHSGSLSGSEKAMVWGALANAIHQRFDGWNAAGPYPLPDGTVVYWGGIPNGYLAAFCADGEVRLGRSPVRPGSLDASQYTAMETLEHYVARHRAAGNISCADSRR